MTPDERLDAIHEPLDWLLTQFANEEFVRVEAFAVHVNNLLPIARAALLLPEPILAYGDLIDECVWCNERAADDRSTVTHASDCPWLALRAAIAGGEG